MDTGAPFDAPIDDDQVNNQPPSTPLPELSPSSLPPPSRGNGDDGTDLDMTHTQSATLTNFHIGMPLDVKDTVGKWCEAEILSINTTTAILRITYTYWSNRYDEDLPFSSPRLAPFATHTYQGNPATLKVGQRVEIDRDPVKKEWREGEIVAISDDNVYVYVRYKRKGKQDGEWLERNTPRLRPYGRFKKCLAWKRSSDDERLKAEGISANTQATRRHKK